jgi:hypothetical protein
MSTQRTDSAVVALPFANHRQAALALLSKAPTLSHKAAGFLGHVCVAESLTDRQHQWLAVLLKQFGLPPLAAGREA